MKHLINKVPEAESSSKNPLVSLLAVNYKQRDVSIAFVKSVAALHYRPLQLVLVDNGEEDAVLRQSVEEIPGALYLPTHANLGFAGGNNFGLPHCTGDYVFFVNNDTELPPDCLQGIISFAQQQPRLGMLSPKIRYYHQPDLIQYAGFTPLSKISIRNEGIGYQEVDRGQYDEVRTTAFIHGAAMLVPAAVIDRVGKMYEDYFLYYEEYDWNERIRQQGYETWYYGLSHIFHKESVSTGVDSPLKIYYLTRNRMLFARRNYSSARSLLTMLYFTFIAMPKNVLSWLIKKRPDLAKAFFKAYIWNLTHKAGIVENRY